MQILERNKWLTKERNTTNQQSILTLTSAASASIIVLSNRNHVRTSADWGDIAYLPKEINAAGGRRVKLK